MLKDIDRSVTEKYFNSQKLKYQAENILAKPNQHDS